MKEIKLSESDYEEISQQAKKNWIDYIPRGSNFVTMCIIKSFLTWLNWKGYCIENGRVYKVAEKNEKNKKIS